MKKWIVWGSLAVVASMSACDSDNDKLNAITVVESQFETTVENWTGAFAEYSTATDTASLEMRFYRARLPALLDSTKYGLRMQGHNRSDDMFMYLRKKVSGLVPNRNYLVSFDINLGTAYGNSGIGAGGSQGTSGYLKAGASPNEPVPKLVNGFYTVNIDKGIQSESGKEMVVLGNVANGLDTDKYALVSRSNRDNPVPVKANANGEIWLCVGTDSGSEGLTVLYYDKIKATITESSAN